MVARRSVVRRGQAEHLLRTQAARRRGHHRRSSHGAAAHRRAARGRSDENSFGQVYHACCRAADARCARAKGDLLGAYQAKANGCVRCAACLQAGRALRRTDRARGPPPPLGGALVLAAARLAGAFVSRRDRVRCQPAQTAARVARVDHVADPADASAHLRLQVHKGSPLHLPPVKTARRRHEQTGAWPRPLPGHHQHCVRAVRGLLRLELRRNRKGDRTGQRRAAQAGQEVPPRRPRSLGHRGPGAGDPRRLERN
mmetsp:Transcript_24354/g.61710  ORF Transcript_24354/g.61710 Transcript_24354/m.61710 type:complete len:256 (-) Transcript_24354:945-1712(-)